MYLIGNSNKDISGLDYASPLNGARPDGTLQIRLDKSDISPGNASKLALKLVHPVDGVTNTAAGSGLYLPTICTGAFDTVTAVQNLEDNVTAPNNFNVSSTFLLCEDIDGDGIENRDDPDMDGDGTANENDTDMDGDSISNTDEKTQGSNPRFADTDADGTPDNLDAFPQNPYMSVDADGDGFGPPYDTNDSSLDAQIPMVTIWRVASDGDSVELPLVDHPSLNITVDWGDSSSSNITSWNDPASTHAYTTAGDYTVKITGTLPAWDLFARSASRDQLIAVPLLGELGFEDLSTAFYGARYLKFVGGGDTSQVTDMSAIFSNGGRNLESTLSLDLTNWNTSNVTNLDSAFNYSKISGNFSTIDTSNVQSMHSIFYGTSTFDSADLNSWNTSNVTTLQSAFRWTSFLNLDVNQWDVRNVGSILQAFSGTHLSHIDIRSWDTSGITDMLGAFIGMWGNTGIDPSSFNTSNVQNISVLFSGADYQFYDFSTWDVSNVTDMQYFADWAWGHKFTGLENWNTSNVQDMTGMFQGLYSQDQNLEKWITSNVTTVADMFSDNASMTTSILSWDLSNVTSSCFFSGAPHLKHSPSKCFSAPLTAFDFQNSGPLPATDFSVFDMSTFGLLRGLQFLTPGSLSSLVKTLERDNPGQFASSFNSAIGFEGFSGPSGNRNLQYCIYPPSLDIDNVMVKGYGEVPVFCVDEDGDGIEASDDRDDLDPSVGI